MEFKAIKKFGGFAVCLIAAAMAFCEQRAMQEAEEKAEELEKELKEVKSRLSALEED